MFFTAGFLSNTGTWMQTVTVPFVIDQLTHSTALVGVSAFAAFFPATVALGALVGMGLAQELCMVSCNTAIQLNVDESYRGRASSMFTMSFFAAAPIGALIGGIIGDLVDLRVTIVSAGVILGACTCLAALRFQGLHPLDHDARGVRRDGRGAPRVAAAHRPRQRRPPGGRVGRLATLCAG